MSIYKKTFLYEYDKEKHIRMERQDAYEDGYKVGVAEGLSAARAEGLATGREQIVELISRMSADGLGGQISRLANDPAFYQEMMHKYFR